MIHGYITEEFKKFMAVPYSGFLILLLILGLFIMLLNGLIHNGSTLLIYIYRFLFYSALFTFIYAILLSFSIIKIDFVLLGILIIAVFFIFSYRKNFALQHLQGFYYIQNNIVKAKGGEKYYELKGLSNNYTILSDYFIKDDKAVYCLSDKIEGLDPATCEIVLFEGKPTLYIKDATNVFYADTHFENADPQTFKIFKFEGNHYEAKDKKYSYSNREQYVENSAKN